MFESLALETRRGTRQTWTTMASFVLQTAGIGLLILAPLGYTEAIAPRVAEHLVAPSGMTTVQTQAPPTRQLPSNSAPSLIRDGVLVYHGTPQNVHRIVGRFLSAVSVDPFGAAVAGGSNVATDSTMDKLLATMKPSTVAGPPATTRTKPYSVSHLDEGMLIRKVQPVYPKLAIESHTQGAVVLAALIDTQGRITNLRALRGHPLLIPAAISAVQQWRYRPYILNGVPVEVETQITVNFSLE